jgi:4-amino-4-deoxy-L-arabinose transferase-like glycosyltransferase
MFAEKLVSPENAQRNTLIFSAGIVAALTNTFLDSFWFSAVEAEVYAMSSFFTSLTFWALLRWYKSEESEGVDRWIVFIGFLIGLALGTHMLNLLVIPTVCLAYYFKKYKVSPKGIFMALIGSAVALGFVMKIIYPGIPWLLANMDKLFVNGFSMPFYSGSIFAIALVFAAIIYLLVWSHKKGSHNWNVIFLTMGFIIFGYSSYAMVIIRSMANPAIDMNKSGTRREDLLLPKETLNRLWVLRKVVHPMSPIESMEFLIQRLERTETNDDFIKSMNG